MKKVLIFGLWWQWQKYINFFKKNWYIVCWVCVTEKTKKNIIKNFSIQVFLESESLDYSFFDLIIFALPPIIQWKKALEILSKWYINKVIIEIPVSFENSEIKKLSKYKNVYFFLEEYFTLLSEFIRKIDFNQIDKIDISIFTNKSDYDNLEARKVTFLHINSNFLWLKIKNNIFNYEINFHDLEDIFYEVSFNYKWNKIFYKFSHEKYLKIWEKIINDDFNFDKVLSKIVSTNINFSSYYIID